MPGTSVRHVPARTSVMNLHRRILGTLLFTPALSHAAFTFNDIEFWTGSGSARAALVIDWNDGSTTTSYAWGYRWNPADSRTGENLFLDVVAADPRLTADASVGALGLFVSSITFDPDGPGSLVALTQTSTSDAPFLFFNYYVNNAVFNDPVDFTNNSHILPPNGEPYAETAPGIWVSSSTGASSRPLADGSYDGWSFGAFGTPAPAEPVAATAVPEPGAALLAAFASLFFLGRRRCA